MDRRVNYCGGSLETDINRWLSVKGGTDRDGNPIEKPLFLAQAELIDGLCQRYGQLPSAILKENASVLKMVHAVILADDTQEQIEKQKAQFRR